ncbi:MAG TPA: tetratricopeptide repeat protein [Thermoanaerobaculia bacterium]|jgi:Tfp pilus assembly protein PilF
MRRAFLSSLTILTLLLIGAGCRSADTQTSETQRQFGVRMARMNLWREAMFRFRRAVQIDPDDAMAHNNLAVALEANGDFDAAAKEYREALRLDRSDQHIQKNYSRFVEFTQKSKKREANAAATSTSAKAAAQAATSTAPATPATAPAPPATPAAPLEPPMADPEPATPTTTTNPPDGGSR